MFENMLKFNWKYVKNNQKNDFDFAGWVLKTPCLFHFRNLKFHHVEETYMIMILMAY